SQGKTFSLKGTYNVIAHICNALSAAHQETVHGVITSSNVLVNNAGRVKLTDFGLSRLLPYLSAFQAQLDAGTLYSVAPEIAKDPDWAAGRADVYSAGILLFELLTGQKPVGAGESPSSIRPDLPQAVDEVVERCIRQRPTDRFS